ncbi:MAG: hypothetical protein FJZ95_00340 [Chloroflexi bacterium]|nr:hypothetical protein [Chloroflexota bacterium]
MSMESRSPERVPQSQGTGVGRPPGWRRFLLPQTGLGRWATGLFIAFVILMVIQSALVMSRDGEDREDETFFDNLPLAALILVVGALAIGAGAVAAIAIIKKRERALPVFLILLFGLFALMFAVGEMVGHE